MNSVWRPVAYIIGFTLIGVYGVIALRGPQGIPALLEKRNELRSLQEQNTNLRKEIQQKRDRVQRLKVSQAEQELEIRKQLKLLHKGETSFILPEEPKVEESKPEVKVQ